MKKVLSVVLSAAMTTSLICGACVSGEKGITVELNGNEISFDVQPQMIDGRTMVPLRKIFEELGAYVKWDNDTQTVQARKNSKTITLSIDSSDMSIDKGKTDEAGNPVTETVTLDVPPKMISDRTLVPVRAVSESFNLNVDWNEEEQKVIITSDETEDDSWKENTGNINLSDLTFSGDGISVSDNQISVTKGGDFTLSGKLENGSITIATEEKVKLRLSNAEITTNDGPCIFAESADKLYITVTDDTENSLTATNSDKGAIYSKDNLEIKGSGDLNISSDKGHGIKASDNLTIENGNITIAADGDGIHVNDTFKLKGGSLKITANGDGIDCESIVNISGGSIDITTNGVPTITENNYNNQNNGFGHGGMPPEDSVEVTFEKSSKGINAEWMMCISGGDININSASHGIHCKDEIEVSGGSFNISSEYGKGISAHGNMTISNSDTFIDITKSTEGLESKNVLTINDGKIKIVSSDDGINATGGNSGEMMPFGGGQGNKGDKENKENKENIFSDDKMPGQDENIENGNTERENRRHNPENMRPNNAENGMPDDFNPDNFNPDNPPEGFGNMMPPPDNGFGPGGGHGGFGERNLKDCLVINGGDIEICSEDDCLDSNGNLVLNGGTIKAVKENGTFTGPNSVLDPDGTISISENVTLVAAGRGGTEGMLEIPVNNITVYFDSLTEAYTAGSTIELKDRSGNVLVSYTPNGSFEAILIASPAIEIGQMYTLTVGDDTQTINIAEKDTVVGTPKNGFGRDKFRQK